MMTHLIRIGNSLGVRIPKAIITQAGFTGESTLLFKVIEEGLLITKPSQHSREGWQKAFEASSDTQEEHLMGTEIVNEFDRTEWKW